LEQQALEQQALEQQALVQQVLTSVVLLARTSVVAVDGALPRWTFLSIVLLYNYFGE
jgi:hypothetical protein